MDDPGAIIDIISFLSRALALCVGKIRDYNENLDKAPKIACEYMGQLIILEATLRRMSLLINSSDATLLEDLGRQQALKFLETVKDDIEDIEKTMHHICDSITNINLNAGTQDTKHKCIPHYFRPQARAFDENKVKEVAEKIKRHVARLVELLVVDTAIIVRETRQQVDGISSRLDDVEKRHFLGWLDDEKGPARTAVSSLHDSARNARRTSDSSTWVQKEEHWIQWRARRSPGSRLLWIHGIPGAGKTVLASYLVDELENYCRKQDGVELCFYYCFHERNHDETLPFLRFLLKRLCASRDNFPHNLLEKFRKAEQPTSRTDLLEALRSILRHVSAVFVTIDAVDESQPRGELLETLRELGTAPHFGKVWLLVTSREEPDIERILSGAAAEIPMSNHPEHREAIRRHIQQFLRAHTHWSSKLRHTVEDQLSLASKGMFRLAVCQLETLRNLTREEDIWKALGDIPEDLYKAYEKILANISDRAFAQGALSLLCYNAAEIPTAEVLVDAVGHWDLVNSRGNIARLTAACGCLVTLSSLRENPSRLIRVKRQGSRNETADLSHKTVREYLCGPEIKLGPAKYFAVDEAKTNRTLLRTIFRGLLSIPALDSKDVVTDFHEYCLVMCDRVLSLGTDSLGSREDIMRDEQLVTIVLDCLNPTLPHFWAILRSSARRELSQWYRLSAAYGNKFKYRISNGKAGVLHNLLHLDWIRLAERQAQELQAANLLTSVLSSKFKMKDSGGEADTVLGVAVRLRKEAFLHLRVISQEVDSSVLRHEPGILFKAMGVPFQGRDLGRITAQIIEWLLLRGADANPKGYKITPLQAATYHADYEWVRTLIYAGARPHAVGDPDGRPVPDRRPNGDAGRFTEKQCEVANSISQLTPLEICREEQNDREFREEVYKLLRDPPMVVDEISDEDEEGLDDNDEHLEYDSEQDAEPEEDEEDEEDEDEEEGVI
ncbi:hypothetical protein NKR23_g9596 [Pleurostoma richardsiae]|uniref:NACHT domain-containing protein n=1 Tax=Pleurostoma richardsiae TaxID=41990 RepID=A0AA38VJS6_9PEZI|nr:hypothetical protein NKR23_g9596 [Pleurostoma richardsiae]